MNTVIKRNLKAHKKGPACAALISAALLYAVSPAQANTGSEAQSLARGSVEDVTPQQKYRTAIREAGGGYKEWLRECANLAANDRRGCTMDAKATYDRDMANARLILRGR